MAAPCLELVLSRHDRAYVFERSHGLGSSASRGSGDEPPLITSGALRCFWKSRYREILIEAVGNPG